MIQTEDSPIIKKRSATKATPGWGYRHLVALLAFFGFFNVYCMRVNLSVAIVQMVKSSNASQKESSDCPVSGNSTSNKITNGEFDWSPDLQGYILGSFFYGYLVTQIPGGWLAERFGGKLLLGFGILGTAILTLLTPLAARWHVGVLIAVRVLEGIGEGVTFPAMHAMWGKWAPTYERTKLTGFSYTGAQLGTVFAMPLSGLLCKYGFAGGWPSVFYVFGSLACVWFVFWMIFIYDTPESHPKISIQERDYIEASVGRREKLSTPWKAILKSPAVWALCIAHFANNWGFYTMLTTLPSYMKNILKFDIQTSGFISALPYLGCWIGQISSGFFADFLRSHHILSTVWTRRVLTFFGLVTPGLMLIFIKLAGCNQIAVIVILVLCLGAGGITMGGFQVNHIDLSPNFAGVLMGMSNSWATIPGFLGPEIVGWLTKDNDTRDQWQIVFYIAAGIYFAGALLYSILARGTVQPWNDSTRGVCFRHKDYPEVQYQHLPAESKPEPERQ